MDKTVHRRWFRILSTALEEELNVLDRVHKHDLSPFWLFSFLHVLISLIKLIF